MLRLRMVPSLFSALTVAATAFADCGSIPFKPWVSVYEPNQRAVVAFDGEEEILILSTDLKASASTSVLEVLPLPSEPELKKSDVRVFFEATELINRKLFPRKASAIGAMGGGSGGTGGAAMTEPPPAGEITIRNKIGAHDISVTHVLDGERFVKWAEEYLIGQGADEAKIPAALKPVIEQYIDEGFKWFAFDVVDLSDEVVTKDAIQYRFKTRWLYYPLRITRAEKGDTKVRLLVLTPGLVRMPTGPDLSVRLVHRPIVVTRSELKELDSDLYQMLRYHGNVTLRIWETEGQLSGFRRDIMTQ